MNGEAPFSRISHSGDACSGRGGTRPSRSSENPDVRLWRDGFSFSRRTRWLNEPNRLSRETAQLRAMGRPLMDLTISNPTAVGLGWTTGMIDEPALYAPEPRGLCAAREAISAYYAARGAPITADRIWLGAGTSDLYMQLMWMLSDPGEAWLVPSPGYPLLDFIAEVCGISLVHYRLIYDDGWHIDMDSVRHAFEHTPYVRAALIIAPHNPTGHRLTSDERDAWERLASHHAAALIFDEVFLDYPLQGDGMAPSCAGSDRVLNFALSGLSKVAAYPQAKIAWAAVSGPEPLTNEVLARAEVLTDTFLNVAPAMQHQTAQALTQCPPIQDRIRSRCRRNMDTIRHHMIDTPASVLKAKGGWTALIRLPAIRDDEAWALHFLHEGACLVQPGYYFNMESASAYPHIALSLLTEPEILDTALPALIRLL